MSGNLRKGAIKALLIISVPISLLLGLLLGFICYNTGHYEAALYIITFCGGAYILGFQDN